MAVTPRSIDAGVGIGEIFVDKYRVDSILGHGGMGVVAMCTHLALNERVAIKMLRRDVLDDADAVERFMREAQAAVKLKSEFVARVTDVGRSTSNVPYMVMEYLEGHDLGALLEERGSLGLPWAIELTLQACEALAEAHSIGIVHRDVKPSNLFVTWRPDGSALVKVLDFGIYKALAGTATAMAMALTQTQSLLGTPAYMSPEQMRSARNVDERTDLWSLGTVLYELIEGHRPFEAESFSEMCVKVAVDPPGAMVRAPAALQQVVLRCLEKAPEQRYASMAELARDLIPFAQDPHQAQVLVERMTRTLRRSQVQQVEQNPSHSGAAVLDLRSIETAPEPASSGTHLPGPGPASPSPQRVGDGRPASETLAVASPRRRGAILLAAVAAAAAIGAAISLLRGPATVPRAPAEAPANRASQPAAVRSTEPSAAPEPAAAPAPPAEPGNPQQTGGSATAGSATAARGVGDAASPAEIAPGPPGTTEPKRDRRRGAGSGTHRPAGSPAGGAAGHTAAPVDKPACNPWDDQHGTMCGRTDAAPGK